MSSSNSWLINLFVKANGTALFGHLKWRELEITPLQIIYLEGAFAIFLAVGSLTWPLGNDQSFYYFVADSILRGGVPYRDAWELKGPLTYYVYAFVLALFGHYEASIRVFDLFILVLFCWWLGRMMLRLEKQAIPAIFAVVFFLLRYLYLGYWSTAQPEIWGAFLIAVAVSLLIQSSGSEGRVLSSIGVLIALATLFKPTFLIFLLLPLIFSLSDRKRWVPAGMCVLAFSVTIALSLAIVFWNGGLREYWDVLRFLATSYSPLSKRSLLNEVSSLPELLRQIGLVIPYLLVLPALVLIWRTGRKQLTWILTTWFVLAVLLLLAQGTYWWYSFMPSVIAVVVILGCGLSCLTGPSAAPIGRQLATGFAALLIGLSVIASDFPDHIWGNLTWPAYVLGDKNRLDHVKNVADGYHIQELDSVAAYVEGHTSPADTILLWGFEIPVLVMSMRHPPTRFGTFEALITEGPLLAQYRRIFLDDVSRSPPRYIVVDPLNSGYRSESSLWLLQHFDAFNEFLHKQYRLEIQIGQYELWVRSQSSSGSLDLQKN